MMSVAGEFILWTILETVFVAIGAVWMVVLIALGAVAIWTLITGHHKSWVRRVDLFAPPSTHEPVPGSRFDPP
jgi:hypothetical protein